MGRDEQSLTPGVEMIFQRRWKHLEVPSPKMRADGQKGHSLSELMSLVRGRAKTGGSVLRRPLDSLPLETLGKAERMHSGQRWHPLLLGLFVQAPQEQRVGCQLLGAQAQSRSAWRDKGFFEGCCFITKSHGNFNVYSITSLSCFRWKHSVKL